MGCVAGWCLHMLRELVSLESIFVIVQSSGGIFGAVLWNKKFFSTDHHLWTHLIY